MPKKSQNQTSSHSLTFAWIMCLCAALFYAYDFLLRVQPNILIHELMSFYKTDAAGIGTLYAAYYWIYTPMQIPSGLIVDRYNLRYVLSISALLCAMGAILFATINIYYVAAIARILMGLGSAVAFIGALKLAANWLPQRYFGIFSGIGTSFGTVGAIATNVLLPFWVLHFGWQQAVMITGYIGLGITLLLFLVVHRKQEHKQANTYKRESWSHTFKQLWVIIKQPSFWLNGLAGSFIFLPITVLAGLWGTSFIERAYKLHTHDAAIADAIIFIGTTIGGPVAGWVSDKIKRRKAPMYVGAFCSCVLLLTLIYEHNISLISLYALLFFIGFFAGVEILTFAISKEISPPYTTGTAAASTNFLITIGALIFAPLVGHILVFLWQGKMTIYGTPFYSLQTFRYALLALPTMAFLAMLLLLFVPETFCAPRHKSSR